MKKATFIVLSFLLLTNTFYGQTNVLTGASAGTSLTAAGTNNVFTGVRAGQFSTTANYNVFTGYEAGRYTIVGTYNVFEGYQAGLNNNESYNVFIGSASGRSNKRSNNVYTGFMAGVDDQWGNDNVFTGFKAGWKNVDGDENVFIGSLAGSSLTTGNNNVFIGNSAANNVTSGTNNTFVGNNAGSKNAVTTNTTLNNTYLGANAGWNATGNACVFLGNGAGANVTGSHKLYIDNTSTPTPLIYGDFGSDQVGINTTTIPNGFALAVNGNVAIEGLTAGDVEAASFKKAGGLPGEFLMADGNITTLAGMGITDSAIQNQNSAAQSANLWINGSGIFDGNVGIGTTTTNEKLTVAGNILAEISLNFQDNTKFTVTNANVPSLGTTPFSMPKYGIAAPNTAGSADLWIAGNNAIRMFTGSNPIPTVNILSNKVGIGTLNPDKELTVNGTIHSKEVIVDTAIIPDYVFQKYYTGKSDLKSNYTMPTLTEIETFTKENHHLPNVPSAKEIQQNGLQLGEMSTILLQKVEELTLYAIEQNKVIEELKAQVTTLISKKK